MPIAIWPDVDYAACMRARPDGRLASLAMVLAWLTCHSDDRLRRAVLREDEFRDDTYRARVRLPVPPWLQNRLQLHGLEHRQQDDMGLMLFAAADLRPDTVWDGPLSQLGAEGELLWQYAGCPCNSYTAEIADIVMLSQPYAVPAGFGGRGDGYIRRPTHVHPFLPSFTDVSVGQNLQCCSKDNTARGSVAEVFSQWGDQDFTTAPCISIPATVFALIRCGAWRHLLLLSKIRGWTLLDRALPADVLGMIRPAGTYSLNIGAAKLDPEFLLAHASHIKDWSHAIIAERPDARPILERHLEAIQRIGYALLGKTNIMRSISGGSAR